VERRAAEVIAVLRYAFPVVAYGVAEDDGVGSAVALYDADGPAVDLFFSYLFHCSRKFRQIGGIP
jgi:hypothetical protein